MMINNKTAVNDILLETACGGIVHQITDPAQIYFQWHMCDHYGNTYGEISYDAGVGFVTPGLDDNQWHMCDHYGNTYGWIEYD